MRDGIFNLPEGASFKGVLFSAILLFLIVFDCFAQGNSTSNNENTALDRGIEFYANSMWGEAIVELRRVQQFSRSSGVRAEAQFWIAMSELSSGEYNDAIHDFDEISRIDPLSIRRFEVPYQKARALFYLGDFNKAIVYFTQFADSIKVDGRYINGVRIDNWYSGMQSAGSYDDYDRKASAIYWIGECLYNLEQLDKAEEMFNIVVNQYNKSHKYEASLNRLALIKQKKIEKQLLDIVRWNSAGSNAAGSGGNSGYNDAVLAYKNSIAPYILNSTTKDDYVPAADQGAPNQAGANQSAPLPQAGEAPARNQGNRKNSQSDPETMRRLLFIKDNALKVMDKLRRKLDIYEDNQ